MFELFLYNFILIILLFISFFLQEVYFVFAFQCYFECLYHLSINDFRFSFRWIFIFWKFLSLIVFWCRFFSILFSLFIFTLRPKIGLPFFINLLIGHSWLLLLSVVNNITSYIFCNHSIKFSISVSGLLKLYILI